MRALRLAGLLALSACAELPHGTTLPPDPARDEQETIDLLRELIRFDTINPPQPASGKKNADETALLRHVKGLLAADGIASEIYELEPGRGNLVARVQGTGEKKPILLMAHVDVVNVDRSQWEVDPLRARSATGSSGDAARSDKDDAAIFIQVLRVLARSKARLSRDVILRSTPTRGVERRLRREVDGGVHWDKIACEVRPLRRRQRDAERQRGDPGRVRDRGEGLQRLPVVPARRERPQLDPGEAERDL
jgi:hypothetical protein